MLPYPPKKTKILSVRLAWVTIAWKNLYKSQAESTKTKLLKWFLKQLPNKHINGEQKPTYSWDIQSHTCDRISFHFPAINQGKGRARLCSLKVHAAGSDLGSCLFVSEGPAMFMTSITFPEPGSLELYVHAGWIQFQRPWVLFCFFKKRSHNRHSVEVWWDF